MVCYHPDKFDDHGHYDSGDLMGMGLICYETSYDNVLLSTRPIATRHGKVVIYREGLLPIESYHLLVRSETLSVSHHFVMFGGHWSCVSGDMMYLISPMTSNSHMIVGSC